MIKTAKTTCTTFVREAGTYPTFCDVPDAIPSFWTQLGPLIALAAALYGIIGATGEIIESRYKNMGVKLRIGQRLVPVSKMMAGYVIIFFWGIVTWTEASVTPSESPNAVVNPWQSLLLPAGTFIAVTIFVFLLFRKGEKERQRLEFVTSRNEDSPPAQQSIQIQSLGRRRGVQRPLSGAQGKKQDEHTMGVGHGEAHYDPHFVRNFARGVIAGTLMVCVAGALSRVRRFVRK